MSNIRQYINSAAIKTLKTTIEEAKGNEVFFLARANENALVEEVTPLARGNDSAVSALMQVASQGDVIIHNHPSGVLTPSTADIGLASQYGNMGVGFYIIDNPVDEIYVVVEAFLKEKTALLDERGITKLLSAGGTVAKKLKGFERRPEQLKMTTAVSHAFNQSQIAMVEAGTGTGKSLAYLIPAVHWAVDNKKRVVISTNTINLQEQLINKDIPFLQSTLPVKFKAVLIKGRNNYVCLSKIQSLQEEGDLLIDSDERLEMKTLLEWAGKTADGSRSDLSILPSSSVWEKVACESDNCARIRCEFYSRCFYYRARREAATADLLVVNHHLLFADLAARGETGSFSDACVLPGYSRIILDEAHNIEEVAIDYFGIQVSRYSLVRLLGRFYSIKEREKVREKGLLPFLLSRLREFENRIDISLYTRIYDHTQSHLIPLKESLVFATGQFFEELGAYFEGLKQQETNEIKIRFTAELCGSLVWQEQVLKSVQQLLLELKEFHLQLLSLEKMLEMLPELVAEKMLPQAVELSALTDRIEVTASALGEIFSEPSEDKVRWVEMRQARSGRLITFKQAPLEVSELLADRVFNKFQTVILTSATLTTENRFDYIKRQLGLDRIPSQRMQELILPSSFNYMKQVIIGIPLGIPSPEHPDFRTELSKLVFRSISISQGRALVLFTSYALLRLIYQDLLEPLRALGIRALKQGDAPRHRLTEVFKYDKTSVLFATDSFWEGVDVSGDALENVILTKLPFSVPKEPVVEAKVEAIAKRGGNPFLEYTVPQAVIQFKQGFGRLVRSKTDYGSIMIFDRRVVEKNYGKSFIGSLPLCRLVKGQPESVFSEVARFFEDHRSQSRR